jgi:alpha-glucosidase
MSLNGRSPTSPWLPVDLEGTADRARQAEDAASMLSLYRTLLRLRRAEPALAVGSYSAVAWSDSVLVYSRQHDGRKFQIALNMSGNWQVVPFEAPRGKLVASTCADLPANDLRLRPHEGIIQFVH